MAATVAALAALACDSGPPAGRRSAVPPYPPSPVIAAIEWAPARSIVRAAEGSDNWPVTWADDGHLYAAYGDGRGFEPFVPEKLGLGIARIEGGPEDFRGVNIRAPTVENRAEGRSGKKASGLLAIEGTLYLWARNAGNAQLAWSADHGRTWEWANWRFTISFGHPTFLNFGRDYDGARDDFVYVYSPDSESAYVPADRMVLARVPRERIQERDAYEFFQSIDDSGQAIWSRSFEDRGAAFIHPGRCLRSGVSYSAGLKRFLWVQVIPGTGADAADRRFDGGIAVYDAPEPWGPWTTAYLAGSWDVGPGEAASFPTKWMSADGRTLYLVFSGDDHFSVRRATLAPRG
jgi:hypothetical protein